MPLSSHILWLELSNNVIYNKISSSLTWLLDLHILLIFKLEINQISWLEVYVNS